MVCFVWAGRIFTLVRGYAPQRKTPSCVGFRTSSGISMIQKNKLFAIVLLGLVGVSHTVLAGSIIYAQPNGFGTKRLSIGRNIVATFTPAADTILTAGSLFEFTGGAPSCTTPHTQYDLRMLLSKDGVNDGVETNFLVYNCDDDTFAFNGTTSVDYQMYGSVPEYIDMDVVFANGLDLLSDSIGNQASGWIFNNATSTNGTNYDLYRLGGLASSTSALGAQQVTDVHTYCNVLSGFSAEQCILGLFLVSGDQGAQLSSAAQNAILTKAPIGYATRVVNIVNGTATATLPVISYTFGSSTPLGSLGPWTLDLNTYFAQAVEIGSSTLSDNIDHKNIWDILDPIVYVVAFGQVFLMMIHDITGFNPKGAFSERGALGDTASNDDSYRLKEYLYKNRRR